MDGYSSIVYNRESGITTICSGAVSFSGPVNFDSHGMMIDGYGVKITGSDISLDKFTHQLNIKLSDEDWENLLDVQKNVFEDEIKTSVVGRIVFRKGLKAMKNKRE